jgi:hypothetical protein
MAAGAFAQLAGDLQILIKMGSIPCPESVSSSCF